LQTPQGSLIFLGRGKEKGVAASLCSLQKQVNHNEKVLDVAIYDDCWCSGIGSLWKSVAG